MDVVDHRAQLLRIAEEIGDITRASKRYGSMRIINYVILVAIVIVAGFAYNHWAHDRTHETIIALLIEIGLLVLHALVMFIEHQGHSDHEGRIRRMQSELRTKADSLLSVARALNLSIRRWFGRMGRRYGWF
jgi:hypothetical protein